MKTLNIDCRQDLLDRMISLALAEDLGEPAIDVTTDSIVSSNLKTQATIYCNSDKTVVAGIPLISLVFQKLDPEIVITQVVLEGGVTNGVPTPIAKISGKAKAILTGERIALNMLQRMCGVATTTRKFTEKVKNLPITILDTRKTTPNLRAIEKYAVLVGGGKNHRFGLNDAVLIKDNHIEIAGSITKAVELVRSSYPDKSLEVECTNLREVEESINLHVDRILLDNMSPGLVSEAVKLVNDRCFIEVSGGINLENLDHYLQSGVNAISIGALTHSPISIDLSLEVENHQ